MQWSKYLFLVTKLYSLKARADTLTIYDELHSNLASGIGVIYYLKRSWKYINLANLRLFKLHF